MEQNNVWFGKIAVVTGASAGIGAAICLRLSRAGLKVVGLARRPQLVDKLKSQCEGPGSITSRQCDVSQLEQVKAAFNWIEDHVGPVDVLVNNAGVIFNGHLTDLGKQKLSDEDLLATMDINTKGTIMCSRLALDSMIRRGDIGHIININSIAGHYVPFSPIFNVYTSSKHAVTAFTKGLINELANFRSKVKVTSLSPGLVSTDMGSSLGSNVPALEPRDVADAVYYVLFTPPHVNISELTITAVADRRL